MKRIKTIKRFCLFTMWLMLSSTAYAENENREWTDVQVCEAIAENFNKNELAPLFNGKPFTVGLLAGKSCHGSGCLASCYIDFKLQVKDEKAYLVQVSLYRQGNAYQIFTENQAFTSTKPSYMALNKQPFWQQALPWMKEGFYEYFGKRQIFYIYTTHGDYLMFTFHQPVPSKVDKLAQQQLEKQFIDFMNIVTRQLDY